MNNSLSFAEDVIAAGFHCHFEAEWDCCYSLLESRGRYVCCLTAAVERDLVFPWGLALGIHFGRKLTLCTTFAGGLTYLFPSNVSAALIVKESLALSSVKVTSFIPDSIVKAYRLREVEIVTLTALCDAEYLDDVLANTNFPYLEEDLLDRVRRAGLTAHKDEDSFLHLRHENAEAIAKLPTEQQGPLNSVHLMFMDGLRETYQQVNLLRAVLTSLEVSAFHDAWIGKRIHLHNKFYAQPSTGSRPDDPYE